MFESSANYLHLKKDYQFAMVYRQVIGKCIVQFFIIIRVLLEIRA